MTCPNYDGYYKVDILQGATFFRTLTLKYANSQPIDITGWDARMQIRPSYSSNTVAETLSTANGEIKILSYATGVMTLWLPPERTAALRVAYINPVLTPPPRPGEVPNTKYVYDLETIRQDGFTTRALHGDVYVYGEVTR